MIFGYQSSRDFFESVRVAAQELERTERQIQRMRLAEGIKAQRYGVAGSGGGDVHGMSATDARMDFEERMRRRMEEDRDIVSKGLMVCYGEEGDGGICAILGSQSADSIYWRYCTGASWTRAAEMVSASPKTIRRWCETAMDTVDGLGADSVISGRGGAES